ncbi:MAG: transporter [Gemmatimonadales bacterium]
MTRRGRWPCGALVAALAFGAGGGIGVAAGQERKDAPAIADNSFLLEEAYNQEPGVVQHISAFLRPRGAGTWVYAFTQEWPLFGQTSQLSFTVPVERAGRTGLRDIAVNYRYQLAGTETRVSVAPRLSVLLPTGDEAKGLGTGAAGLQVNLPVSVTLAPRVVTHWNAGATLTPDANSPLGDEATTTEYNLGASVIWLARSTFNVLVEVVWSRGETVTGPGATARAEALFVNPGVRWAHNFPSGLQIVPGIAFPIGVGQSRGEDALFLYLSFEHPF